MKRPLIYSLIILGIILVPVSIVVMTKPLRLEPSEGTIEVNWANPVGIKVNDLQKNDKLSLTFTSEINTSIYFITREQANDYRSPQIYKDPLPDPLITGKVGSLDVTIEKKGDYEFLFLPAEPSRIFTVEYSMDRDLLSEKQVYLFSGMGILLSYFILIVLGIILIIRRKPGHE